ncbi:MAG: deoxyribodipyrimidine photolyase [Proteobacteria bacterium]|nr:MAG: deoxyribodipyrimidine photolyase [Pseudomonadota bacterium]
MSPIIVWFRRDLRLSDNPALTAAAMSGQPIIPLYIHDETGARPIGGASKWWLAGSLQALDAELRQRGSQLVLRRGASEKVLTEVGREVRATAIYWNRLYDRNARDTESIIAGQWNNHHAFNGALLCEPWALTTKAGNNFRVFTPFWNALLRRGEPAPPLAAPARLPAPARWPRSEMIEDWKLRPTAPDWAAGLRATWTPGETAASARLDDFLQEGIGDYSRRRDFPGVDGTSRLSPHLAFGDISPRQIWHRVRTHAAAHPAHESSAASYLRQLGWREFSYHLLYHFPDLPRRNWNARFDAFSWRKDEAAIEAWRRGRTGYPLVDAAMRELWTTGWMHNRARMIVASFLVKDLLLPWQAGEAWFWDTLVDADPANNAAGWQWVAGSGADAAPYFRVFNPITQCMKFDPSGAYIRRWLPELGALPDQHLHRPWDAPADILQQAGVVIGETYPRPIIDHTPARDRALAAYARMKRNI